MAKKSAKLSMAATCASFVVSLIVALPAQEDAVQVLGFLLLVEAAGLMLIGSSMEFSTSASFRAIRANRLLRSLLEKDGPPAARDSKVLQLRAAVITVAGALLLAESLLLAILFYIK